MTSQLSGRAAHYALLLLAGMALTLPNLGRHSLWDIDEGLNAEAAREMVESGNWVVPTFNYELRAAKPVLGYWLQATAYTVFGVNEFSARLPSAVLGMIVMLLVYEIGRRLFDKSTGLLAGLILGSCLQFCLLSHAATPDLPLLIGLVLTMTVFVSGFVSEHPVTPATGWWWVPVGAAIGLAVLAKGPVGLALPAAIMGLWLLWHGRGWELLNPRLAAGVLMMLLVAGPWYLLVGLETKGEFLRRFLFWENLHRFHTPMQNHGGSIFYYVAAIVVGFVPWTPWLPASLWCSWAAEPNRRPAYRFLGLWFLVVLVVFTIARTKLPNYILPLYPPLALLTARFLVRWLRGEVAAPRKLMASGLVGVGGIGAGVAIACVVLGSGVSLGLSIPMPRQLFAGLETWAWIGLVPVAVALMAGVFLWRDRRGWVVASVLLGATGFTGLIAAGPVLTIDAAKAPRRLVAESGACRTDQEIRVAAAGWFQPSLVFYTHREVVILKTHEELAEFLACPLPAWVFLPATEWERLGPSFAATHREVARRYDFYRRMEVVAVANRAAEELAPPQR
jgi:4-amino-4-deoxy-L-arabinose transferase-like glycosyltransferase